MSRGAPPRTADVVIVGAGIVGACCADALSAQGLDVVVVERHALTGGSTAAGEGNILVSDKVPGPELELALLSRLLWLEIGDGLDVDIELSPKGGLVVAETEQGVQRLEALAAGQRASGVEALAVSVDAACELEPHLSRQVAGAVHYPQDLQVQPVQASSALLRRARRRGAVVRMGVEVTGVHRGSADGRVHGIWTSEGRIATGTVVNAAGAWSAAFAAQCGVSLPVVPRRGHILVTEALPPLVRHKVYDADYVGTVGTGAEDAAKGFQVSSVVEGTASGTVLIGSSRELVGYDRTINTAVLAAMARRAITLFPVLGQAQIIRAYLGFRPYSPDHLPIIGEDPEVAGLIHATGHEGAGIGLAPATGVLVAVAMTGMAPPIDPSPFRPGRPSLASARPETESAHG